MSQPRGAPRACLGVVLLIVLLVLLIVLLIPSIVSTSAGTSAAVSAINTKELAPYGMRLEIADLELAWLGPQHVTNFRLLDRQNRELAAGQICSHASLFTFLTDLSGMRKR